MRDEEKSKRIQKVFKKKNKTPFAIKFKFFTSLS